MATTLRSRCTNVAAALACAIGAWFFIGGPTVAGTSPSAVVDIGTAATAHHSRSGGAARTTEAVRYADADLQLVAAHRITDGQPASPDALSTRDRAVWDVVHQVLPPAYLARIHQLNIATDGRGGTLAMVHRSTTTRDAWILTIDPAEDDAVLRPTVVHELGHVLTLGNADLDPRRENCGGVLIEIGCATSGSTLAEFAKRFWTGVAEPASPGRGFVSDYAATSVHEDLAETFMTWVEGNTPNDDTVAAKFAFLASRTELAQAKDALVAGQRARRAG